MAKILARFLQVTTLVLALLPCSHGAQAATPRIGIEIEREKDRESGSVNYGVALQPGLQFAKGSVIDRVELLLDRSQEAADGPLRGHEWETKVFLRIRHSGELTKSLAYYVRGGVGRSHSADESFTYGYVEPGLKYELSRRWEWTLGWREIKALDGTTGERVRKLITGPSFKFDERHEVELRYVRATLDKDIRAWSAGYIYKFF